METKIFDATIMPEKSEEQAIVEFLSIHLEQWGDPQDQIKACLQYAFSKEKGKGGFVVLGQDSDKILACVIVNQTGMKGFIPENVLVYVATHKDYRGKGLGTQLIKTALNHAHGDVALHVEPDNPAKGLYEHLGFTNKYLEMRFKKA